MGWEVLQQLRNRTLDWFQLRGSFMGTAQTVRVLLKDRDENAIFARIEEGVAIPQKKRGFAKGCLLFVDATGPANQNTKGLYENVGTAKLSRFNVIGSTVDPEILLPHKHILLGQHNGISKDVAISGDISIAEDGEVTIVTDELPLADGKILVGGADGKADAVDVTGVIAITNAGVTSFAATYADTHRVVAAGISDAVTDADGEVSVYDSNIATSDIIIATMFASASLAAVRKAECRDGHARVYLTAAGGSGTRVQYVVYRPVGQAGTNPSTTDPPTTATSTTEPPFSTDSPPTTLAPTTLAPTTTAPTTAA